MLFLLIKLVTQKKLIHESKIYLKKIKLFYLTPKMLPRFSACALQG